MHTLSHVLIAKSVYQTICDTMDVRLPYAPFVYGNVSPDFSVNFFLKPHKASESAAYIHNQILFLSKAPAETRRNRLLLAQRLGAVCHYLCDFFCFAHNSCFKGTFPEHVQYENDLHAYLKNHPQVLEHALEQGGMQNNAYELLDHLQLEHACYLRDIRQENRMEHDISCAVKMCVTFVSSVLAMLLEENEQLHKAPALA